MNRPTLSVLIPTFNRCRLLPQSVESVLRQSVPAHQVIVINDGSTDDTRKVLEPYSDRIEYIEQENGGKSSALNAALPRVTGEYVWVFDDDDIAIQDAWEHHAAVLHRRPDVGFTYGPHYLARIGDDGRAIGPLQRDIPPDVMEGELFLRLLERNFMSSQTIFVRTSCYRELGGWDTSLIRSQDYDMSLRLARNYCGERVDQYVCYWRLHEGPRGSISERWTADRSVSKWQEYDHRIFKKLRADLDLREYLPRPYKEALPHGIDSRRAYLQRMAIMLSKGLYEEAAEDWTLAMEATHGEWELTQSERDIFRRAGSHAWLPQFINEQPDHCSRLLRLWKGSIGRVVRQELAHGLYRQAVAARRDKGLRAARVAFAAALRVAGLWGAVCSATSRFIWRRRTSMAARPSKLSA